MADISYLPENQANNMLPYFLAGQNNNGGLFGASGGSAFWGALLGSLVPGLFGGWGNGFGGGFGGVNGAAAALGAQATANNNADLILNAINGTDADVRLLATTLNTDVDSIKLGINTIQGAVAQVGSQVGMSGLQVVNAIQSGNASLASQLCQCCCEMRQLTVEQGYQNQLRTVEQTNTLGSAINANGQRTVDAIADLKTTMVQEFCAVKEREMQSKIDTQADIITQLRNEADNARQTNQIAAMLAPLQSDIDDIKCKQPSTATVTYPNLVAVNATPYVSGGFYQGGYGNGSNYYGPGWGFGNGFGNGIFF